MLSATMSENEKSFETVRRVLSLEAHKQRYSDVLKQEFLTIVKEAISLADDPKSGVNVRTEAIALAVLLLVSNDDFQKLMKSFLETQSLNAENAQNALDEIGVALEATREPAHLSREIYAAI